MRHMVLPCHHTQRPQLIKDLITSYGLGGRTILFTDTKADAGNLALSLQDRCVHCNGPRGEERGDAFKQECCKKCVL